MTTSAQAFVPAFTERWLHNDAASRHRTVDGTMVYVDISGFTELSERLVDYGRVGAEELVSVLGGVIEGIVDRAAVRGGELIEFAGDSTLLFFTGPDHASHACACVVEIHDLLRDVSRHPTEVGKVKLRASAGVHTAAFDFYLLGDGHRQLVCAGPEIDTLLLLEKGALAGQVAVSATTAETLPANAVRETTSGSRLLRWRRTDRVPTITRTANRDLRASADAASLLLSPILFRAVGAAAAPPSHRMATVMFVEVLGTSQRIRKVGADQMIRELDQMVALVQSALAVENVCILSFDVAVDSVKIFACSGAPVSGEDDEGSALRAALAITSASLPFETRAGINRGHVFAAAFGNERRSVYSAMGDTTNTAARICSKAGPNQVLAHPDVLGSARQRYESSPVAPVMLKGKASALALYHVRRELPELNHLPDHALPLVGRTDELASLTQLLRDPADHGMIFVVGDAGIGKTRLVDEAIRHFPERPELRLRSEPRDGALPYAAFRDGLRTHLGLDPSMPEPLAQQLEALLRTALPEAHDYWSLVGDVVHIDMGSSPEVDTLLAEHRPDRTAALVISLLAALQPAPLIITVEGGQWVDSASRRLLERLSNAAAAHNWSIIVTHRDGDPSVQHQFDHSIVDTAHHLTVGRLSVDETMQLARVATRAVPLHQSRLAQLAARSNGNPLFLEELLTSSRTIGSAAEAPGTLLRTLVSRIDHLDQPTRQVLEMAAVLGTTFNRQTLDRLFERRGLRLDDATRLRAFDFLTADGDVVSFRHALMREAVYEAMPFRQRRDLHRDAAELIESSPHTDAEYAALAHHFAAAGDQDRAFEYSVEAAARSERTYAPTDAAQQLRQALDLLPRSANPTPARARDLWIRLALVQDHAALFDLALASLSKARAVSTSPTARAEVELQRARVRERSGHFVAALAADTRAKTVLGGRTGTTAASLRARADAHAAIVYQLQGRAGAATQAAERAVQQATTCNDKVALARSCGVLARASLMAGKSGATELAARSFALFEDVGDMVGQSRMANNLGIDAFYRGDWDEALRWYERCTEIAESTGAVTDGALSRINCAELLVNQGRTEAAEPIIEQSRQDLRAANHWSAPLVDMHLGRLRMAQSRLDEAEALLRSSMEQSSALANALGSYEAALFLGQCLVLLGRPQEAIDQVRSHAALVAPAHVLVHDGIRCLVEASALLRLGRDADAVSTYHQGVQLTAERQLDFDRGQLLHFGVEHDLDVEDRSGEADELLTRFGVVATLPL